MNIPKSLMEAAEKAADKMTCTTADEKIFLSGIKWLFGHLTELSEREFDPPSVKDYNLEGDIFENGARYQHTLMIAKILSLEAEIEQLYMQLAGCGVVAMANTKESLAEVMPEKFSYGWSASLEDVARCIQREMNLMEELEAAKAELLKAREEVDSQVLSSGNLTKEFEAAKAEAKKYIDLYHETRDERNDAKQEIARLKDDLYFVAGFGCDVSTSLYGGLSAIEFMRQIGLPQGARDIAGMEMRCSGEAKSAIAMIHMDNATETSKLYSRVKELEEALSTCHDELVEHYNKAKCFHCNLAIEEAKEALKGSGVPR